jgi:hypothetical protein
MKSKAFFAFSITLNVALAGVAIYLATSRSRPEATLSSDAVPTVGAPNSGNRSARTLMAVVTNHTVHAFDWRMVESEDYRKYITNLRAIGCPEETIRDIIVADVNKLFEQRRREITASTNRFEYWKGGNVFASVIDPDRIEKLQELDKEKRALLRELLGVEPEQKPEFLANFNPFETMLDFLPASKQSQIMDVYMKYQAKMAKTLNGGTTDADDMKAMQKAQKEMDAELAAMLSPQDYREYQLRMSQTAMTMRTQLGSFEPTQQEFDKIFDLRKGFDDEFGMFGGMGSTREDQQKRASAQKELDAQIKTLLGEQRFAEYQRSQDWNYQNLYRITEKYGLSKESANKVYDMQQLAQAEAAKVRSNKDLTPEQRQEALKGIRTETEKSIQDVLPDKAWNSYQSQAYWLNNISREPTPVPQ